MLGGLIDTLGTILNVIGKIIDATFFVDAITSRRFWKSVAIIAAAFLICFLFIYAYEKYHHIW
jgi:hypothetical protein